MPRGHEIEIGSETVAQNGYTWVKTVDGWKYKHWVIAEKRLGRPIDPETEYVAFKDKDRTNFKSANIEVRPKTRMKEMKPATRAKALRRISRLEKELEELKGFLQNEREES